MNKLLYVSSIGLYIVGFGLSLCGAYDKAAYYAASAVLVHLWAADK